MHRLLAHLLFGALALGGACTTELEPTEGQAPWLERCEESSECGTLECICGVCTQACTVADSCPAQAGETVACALVEHALDPARCDGEPAGRRACLPACDGTDCDEDPPDGGLLSPIELACSTAGDVIDTGTYEVLLTERFGDVLAIAPDGAIYATIVSDSNLGQIVRVDRNNSSSFAPAVANVRLLLTDGDQLIVGTTSFQEISIATIDRSNEAVVTLARKPSVNVLGLAADGDSVYWIDVPSADGPHAARIWHSPRQPGESRLLGELMAPSAGALHVVGDSLYFLAATFDSGPLLFRASKDGGDMIEYVDVMTELGNELLLDGEDLFVTLADGFQGGPSINGIGRWNPTMPAVETLFDTGGSGPRSLTVGTDYVYWVLHEMPSTDGMNQSFAIWRGRKDGEGSAEKIAVLIGAEPQYLRATADSLYWLTQCQASMQRHLTKLPLQ